jgi:transposase
VYYSVVPTILDPEIITAFRSGQLTELQADTLAKTDSAELKFLFLQLSAAMVTKASPHQPSGSKAPWEKAKPSKRHKQPGASEGHEGHAREKPERIDHQKTVEAPSCPDCGGELKRTGRKRTRVVEDFPADLKAEATEFTIHRDWCPCCKKQVEPVVTAAMPACTLGNQAVTFSSYLHYAIGTSTQQVVDVFNVHLQLKISAGGLTQMWHRLADKLSPWYDAIWKCCQNSAVLNADETGWHLNGDLVWMWCFCTPRETYYAIDPKRGSEALNRFFVEEYQGILVTDFWRAYDAVNARMNQKCWAHMLRELQSIDDHPEGSRDDWPKFSKSLKRIYTDAVKVAASGDTLMSAERDSRICRLHTRITDLAVGSWTHPDAQRLAKRLLKDGADLLTFTEFADVPATNNRAEREIRPAVLMRKVSYGSASELGMRTRSILMSVYRTLKNRGLDPLAETRKALEILLETGQLPQLPGSES